MYAPDVQEITKRPVDASAAISFALAHPTKQQNGLCWPEVLSLKHSPTVQVVDALTTRTPVYCQPAFLAYAEHTCRLHAPAAMWTFQLVLVKVLQQPNRAQIIIE